LPTTTLPRTGVPGVNTDFTGQLIADGRYEVRRRLGSGSMGHVFQAWDHRLQTDVVLKVPTLARLEQAEFRERFLRESRFLVRLTHPRIITILDVGEHESIPYFVMQYVGGGSLESRIHPAGSPSAPMPVASVKDWLPGVAEALDFMHRQGYVHRDVKPANILYDEHGHAYLSDFGLSKLVGGTEEESSAMTAAGFIVGTPNYVAPEVVLGQSYDGRADQYSLAMTLYEALTGRCPLEGPTATATMVNQTAMLPPPPSRFNPRVPEALARVVLRGLAKTPDKRYAHCTAFAAAVLEAAGIAASSGARPRPPASRSSARYSGVTAVLPPPQYAVLRQVKVRNLRAPCPKCQAILKLQQNYAGRKGRCKKCQAALLISRDLKEVLHLKAVRRAGVPDDFDLEIATEVFGFRLNQRQAIALISLLLGVVVVSGIVIGVRALTYQDERQHAVPIKMNER
jgi:serine/threonine protein kinase